MSIVCSRKFLPEDKTLILKFPLESPTNVNRPKVDALLVCRGDPTSFSNSTYISPKGWRSSSNICPSIRLRNRGEAAKRLDVELTSNPVAKQRVQNRCFIFLIANGVNLRLSDAPSSLFLSL